MANVDIHAIVSTIENYENKIATPISDSNNSTVTNNSSVPQTVIDLVPINNAQIQISTIPILKYQGKSDNKFVWHKW